DAAASPEPEGHSGHDHRHAQPLPHRHVEREVAEELVGLAEELGDEAQHAVADEERARDLAETARLLAVDLEDDEEEQTLERELIKLGRMARLQRTRLRKDHRPRQRRIGEAPPQLAVDEVADSPCREPGRHARRDEVGDLEELALARAREERDRDDDAEEAAVKRHPALPDHEDLERMRSVVPRLVEQHVAEPAADDGAEDAVEEQILDVAPRPATLRELRQPRAPPGEKEEQREADQIRDAIPVDRQRDAEARQVERDRVELRMPQHASMIRAASPRSAPL